MHVLCFFGNPPSVKSGYGGQVGVIIRALLGAGHTTTVMTLAGKQDFGRHALRPTPIHTFAKLNPTVAEWVLSQPDTAAWQEGVTWVGLPYPKYPTPLRKSEINQVIAACGAELVLTLFDIFVMVKAEFSVPSMCLQPLHFIPVPHKDILALSDFDVMVGISQYGRTMMRQLFGPDHGLQVARHFEVIEHSRDVMTTFTPLPGGLDASDEGRAAFLEQRRGLRKQFGMPLDDDTFVILIAGSGSEESDRKKLSVQILAACLCMQERELRGLSSFLYLHTEVLRFYDIPRLLEIFGEFPKRYLQINFEDARARTKVDEAAPVCGPRFRIVALEKFMELTDTDVANMIRAADVVLHATASEGCGVGIIEAQACGVPVVTSAVTAMTEITEYGFAVPASHWVPRNDFNSGWWEPNPHALVEALHTVAAWSHEERVDKLMDLLPALQARFHNDRQTKEWTGLFNRLEEEVVGPLRTHAAAFAAAGAGASTTQVAPPRPPTSIRIPASRWQALCAHAALRPFQAQCNRLLPHIRHLHGILTAIDKRRAYVRGALMSMDNLLQQQEDPVVPPAAEAGEFATASTASTTTATTAT